MRLRKLNSRYKNIVGHACANPECKSGYGIEAHHVLPIKKYWWLDVDRYWNLVCLCHDCHTGMKLHRRGTEREAAMFVFKCHQEMGSLGFVMDEMDPKFRGNLARHLAKRRGRKVEREVDPDAPKRWAPRWAPDAMRETVAMPPPPRGTSKEEKEMAFVAAVDEKAELRASVLKARVPIKKRKPRGKELNRRGCFPSHELMAERGMAPPGDKIPDGLSARGRRAWLRLAWLAFYDRLIARRRY